MKETFCNIDKKLKEIYEKSQESFCGRMIVKLTGEIILAGLIALAIYLATTFYHKTVSQSEENRKIEQLYISMSNDYIHSLFGIPFISIVDRSGFRNDFYILNRATLRTVVDDNRIVAFFITAVEKNAKFAVDSFWEKRCVLGEVTYSELNFPNPTIKASVTGSGRYSYYVEIQGTGRYGMYNDYLFGCLPYGHRDSVNRRLAEIELFGSDNDKMQAEALRKSGIPNTFGVIATGYRDSVDIVPICEEWENAYYLLTNRVYNWR